ncbi:MAG: hypothetical protein Q9M14_02745 [Mariprofundaceae bacterium]|nr:hypothetical protein [Mariprofundaceae bacterium]
MKIDHAALVKQCCEILRHEILPQQHDNVAELASYIVGVTTRHSLSELINDMIQGDVLPSDLTHALMKCQLLILEQQMPVIFKDSPDKQIQALKEMVEHFNYIASSIVQVGEKLWSNRVEALHHDLKVEQKKHILNVSMQIWRQQDKIKLLNYYKGLPVQVMADIECVEAVDQPMITVHSSAALGRVLAMQKNEFVLTPDSEDEVLIQLQVKREQGEKVSFLVKSLSTIKKRKYFRLEPIETMAIQLYRNKKTVGKGKVLDLSLKHMDISMPEVKDITFEVNEIVDICFLLQKKEVKGCAWVRHIRLHEQEVVLCLELMPQAHLQRNLQQEVASLQRGIIQEIKEKFTVVQV